MECQPGQSCFISQETMPGGEIVLFERGCSGGSHEEDACSEETEEGGSTKICHCSNNFCNKNWLDAGWTEEPDNPTDSPTQPAETINCYSCDSNTGKCDEEEAGDIIDCPINDGCVISKDNANGQKGFMRGCSREVEPEAGCSHEEMATTCYCKTPMCNLDWDTAGSTTMKSDTTTTQEGPTVECYKCDFTNGDCTEEELGEVVNCPADKGCTISKIVSTEGKGMLRDCSVEGNILCDTINNDLGILSFCNCDTALCNKDWKSAGSTESPETTPETETTTKSAGSTESPVTTSETETTTDIGTTSQKTETTADPNYAEKLQISLCCILFCLFFLYE